MEHTYRMVVGVDGSEAGQRALQWAVAEASRRNKAGESATVQALTAWEFDPVAEAERRAVHLSDPRIAAERLLSEAVATASKAHPDVIVADEVVRGIAHDVLVRAADQADLLVLGSHGNNEVHRTGVGSVAEGCIRNATCPVLVIPMAHGASTSALSRSVTATTP